MNECSLPYDSVLISVAAAAVKQRRRKGRWRRRRRRRRRSRIRRMVPYEPLDRDQICNNEFVVSLLPCSSSFLWLELLILIDVTMSL
jgi:hypothetical protein